MLSVLEKMPNIHPRETRREQKTAHAIILYVYTGTGIDYSCIILVHTAIPNL